MYRIKKNGNDKYISLLFGCLMGKNEMKSNLVRVEWKPIKMNHFYNNIVPFLQ
jgi:hypothetical protein